MLTATQKKTAQAIFETSTVLAIAQKGIVTLCCAY